MGKILFCGKSKGDMTTAYEKGFRSAVAAYTHSRNLLTKDASVASTVSSGIVRAALGDSLRRGAIGGGLGVLAGALLGSSDNALPTGGGIGGGVAASGTTLALLRDYLLLKRLGANKAVPGLTLGSAIGGLAAPVAGSALGYGLGDLIKKIKE